MNKYILLFFVFAVAIIIYGLKYSRSTQDHDSASSEEAAKLESKSTVLPIENNHKSIFE